MSSSGPSDDLRYLPVAELSMNLRREIDQLRPSGTKLVHYTSLDSFYSIMDSARVRLSSVKSTNDPSEFLFGLEVVRRGLSDSKVDARPAEISVIEECEQRLDRRQFKAFVFCMSEAIEDEVEVGDLSQWRLYGSDGRGIALIFDVGHQTKRDELISLISIPRKVVYGSDEGANFVKKQIQDFFNAVKSLPEQSQEFLQQYPSSFAEYLGNIVFWLPSVIKHKAYRHEREVRLIRGDIGTHAGNPLVFYDRGTIRRPGIELPISMLSDSEDIQYHSSPISKVIIGPSGDQASIDDSIRFFLEARNWSLEICRSDIPYRAV